MDNTTKIKDLTRLFLGLQDEARASLKSESIDIRIHLNQAAADLSTYFENPSILPTALGAGGLTYEYAFLQHNCAELWIDTALRMMLDEFRSARNVDTNRCFQIWGNWFKAIDRSIGNNASVAFLQADLDSLSLEFKVKSILRDVGDILEGSLQPLARLRLDMQDVIGMRKKGSATVLSMDFGKVIEELASRPNGGDIYFPKPFELTVSQWRNIANHNSYYVEDGDVICTYGKPGHHKTIRLSINDLYNVGVYINNLNFTHKIAFEFFSIDNMSALSPHLPHVDVTDYTINCTLAYGLVAAGFSIEKVGYGDEADYGTKRWALFLVDDHNRSRLEAETALKDAVSTYVLLADSINVIAFVKSNMSLYEFSFKAKISNKDSYTSTSGWDIRALDQ